MGICFGWFLSFYSVFLLKFLSNMFWLFSVSRFEKQQKYPFNPKQENKGNFWYFSLWRAQTSLCFGARRLVLKELSVLCFVAVSPANLGLGQFLCLWKTAVYTLTQSHETAWISSAKSWTKKWRLLFWVFLSATAFLPIAQGAGLGEGMEHLS